MKAQVSPLLEGRTTVAIVRVLQRGPTYPKALADELALSQGYVSNRLTQLNSHGFVSIEKVGRHRIYSLSLEGEQHVQAHEASRGQKLEPGRGRPDLPVPPSGTICPACGSSQGPGSSSSPRGLP